MKNRKQRNLLAAAVLAVVMVLAFACTALASDDNSLADLGITTPGATVTPDFQYDIWEYSVQVPAGTTELTLSPRATHPAAVINSVTGTTLNEDGTGRVVITITSESGNAIEYVLNVSTARGQVDPAAAIAANESSAAVTIDTEVVQSEVETEDPRYVKVDRNSLEDAKETIERLQKEIIAQREHIRMLTYVLYGLIAVSIIFLFILISLLLRRRDLAQELHEYRASDPYRTKGGKKGNNVKVAADGWGEWDDEDQEPVNAQTSWTQTQVGTPVQPQRAPQGSGPQYQKRNQPASGKGSTRHPDETRMYRGGQPVRAQDVPKDVTKDLTKVNKAEAKAMKRAAAARAKEEQDARRASQARAAEAKRQAEEARKIEQQKESARAAQEEALRKAQEERRAAAARAAEAENAARQASEDNWDAPEQEEVQAPRGRKAGKDKGVQIDMIDL